MSDGRFHQLDCPSLLDPSEFKSRNILEDFTGLKIDRLTVLGVRAEGKGRWVVRCLCGYHEVRTSKSLKNTEGSKSCEGCQTIKTIPTKELIEPTAPIRNKPPERTGCGKMGFKSESAAKKAAKNRLKHGANCDRLRTYFCRACKSYHMTSTFRD